MSLIDLDFLELKQESQLDDFECVIDDSDCKEQTEDIAAFLKDDALNYQIERMANTYLFCERLSVKAFFSISNDCLNSSIKRNIEATNSFWNKFHRLIDLSNAKRIKQYPAVKIGRLGVHKEFHKTGLAYELMDFIKGWVIIDHKPACRLLLLDAINDPRQINFYKKNGFQFLIDSDENERTRIMFYDLQRLL